MGYGTLSLGEAAFTAFIAPKKVRGFEKVTFEQYFKDIGGERSCAIEEWHDIELPQRATQHSSGYDFKSPFSFELQPGETIKIPTGIKTYMQEREELLMFIRSSLGFKYDVVLRNCVGKIDMDYYDNKDNEGHIWIGLINHGSKVLEVKKGDAIAQGTFYNFLIADKDVPVSEERVGGIGSTNQ